MDSRGSRGRTSIGAQITHVPIVNGEEKAEQQSETAASSSTQNPAMPIGQIVWGKFLASQKYASGKEGPQEKTPEKENKTGEGKGEKAEKTETPLKGMGGRRCLTQITHILSVKQMIIINPPGDNPYGKIKKMNFLVKNVHFILK